MRTFFILWRRELAAYFLSPIAYVVGIFFLVVLGFSFWMLVSLLVQGEAGVSAMNELFGSIFFWLAMLISIPVLSMRLVAEERRAGTLETLMTAPVSETAVILAKFAGAQGFFMAMWLPTLLYAYLLRRYSSVVAPIDLGPMLGGYLGAFLLGAFYISIGLFCSCLTRNQIVAAMSAFALITVAFLVGFLPYISQRPEVREFTASISAVAHMLDFSRGVLDTRPLVLYLSGAAFMLFLSVKALESRRWRSGG